MKLIDKDALLAEIEKRQRRLNIDSPHGIGAMVELECIKDTINALEVKEMDLEEEIDDWYRTMGIPITVDALKETARHFFELGLKAKNK